MTEPTRVAGDASLHLLHTLLDQIPSALVLIATDGGIPANSAAPCWRQGVVAEGVETEEQLRFLTAMHCDIIQGYLVSPPLIPAAARRFLAERTRADRAA